MHTTTLSLATAAGLLSLFVGTPTLAQSQVVFDNSANLINKTPEIPPTQEYGDEIFLAGRARLVTEFDFAYFASVGTTVGVSYAVRFYVNDGTDALPGAATALRPKSLLWDSGLQDINNGVNKVALSVPSVLVPDHFTWTITFQGLNGTPGKQAALVLADPATVGAVLAPATATEPALIGSYDDFWKKEVAADADSWTLYTLGSAPTDPKGNFFAVVKALPYDPPVQITRVGSDVVLSWPAILSGYVLESSADLKTPISWLPVATPPVNLGGINYVTNVVVPGVQFYRLHHP